MVRLRMELVGDAPNQKFAFPVILEVPAFFPGLPKKNAGGWHQTRVREGISNQVETNSTGARCRTPSDEAITVIP